MKDIVTVGVWCNGRALLLQRPFDDTDFPGQWTMPGGKVEESEGTYYEAAIRELKEETGLWLGLGAALLFVEEAVSTQPGHTDKMLHHYRLRLTQSHPPVTLNNEHIGYGWFTAQEAAGLPMPENVRRYLERGDED